MEPDQHDVPGTSKARKVIKKPKEETKAAKNPKPTTSTEDPVISKSHHTIYDIVYQAIETLGTSRKGVSFQAIKKHVYGTKGDDKNVDSLIKKAIIKGFEKGVFAKPKNKEYTGATGSFLLVKKKVEVKKSEKLKRKNEDIEEHVSDSEAVTRPSKIRKRNLSDTAIEDMRPQNSSTPKLNNRMMTKILTEKASKTKNLAEKATKAEILTVKASKTEIPTVKASKTKVPTEKATKVTVNKKPKPKKEGMNERKDSSDSEVSVKRKRNLSKKSYASETELDFVKEKKTAKSKGGMKKNPKAEEPIPEKRKKLFNVSEKVEKEKNIKTTRTAKKKV